MTTETGSDLPEQAPIDNVASVADLVGADLVPLSVGAVPVIATDEGPLIAFRHAVEALGLSYAAQWRRIRARQWARVAQTATHDKQGRRQLMVTVDVRTFVMWLATIDETRVRPELRPALIAFQREAADVLYAYVTRGLAVNPRGRTPAQVALIEAAGEGLIGPVLTGTHGAHVCIQYLDGRRDMPPGETRATIARKRDRYIEQAHIAAVAAGLDARYALAGEPS